ncbi:hypothetical protein GCM10027063_40170 [Promicromonospora xylanilytica]
MLTGRSPRPVGADQRHEEVDQAGEGEREAHGVVRVHFRVPRVWAEELPGSCAAARRATRVTAAKNTTVRRMRARSVMPPVYARRRPVDGVLDGTLTPGAATLTAL